MMIFAREISDNLTGLVKKVDEATVKNAKARMGSFVVVCNDDEKMEEKLKELAKKEGIKKTVLSLVDRKAGPSGYELHPEADITVVMYTKRNTKAQYAFKKGELKEKDVASILEDLPKILPAK
ncbi:MAG: hypothetical protein U0840_23250 [Gemmataceae bacterium]